MDAYEKQRWTGLYRFLNVSGSGLLTISELMEYPCHLLREGKVEDACRIAKVLKRIWDANLEQAGRSKGETSLNLEDWIKGHYGRSEQDWYHNEAIPSLAGAMFDIMDENHDNLISLAEWRDHYKRHGVKNEEFVRSTFAKMDTNSDGSISRQEFEYALKMYLKHDPDNDYSFLYTVE
ncbi:uncharacterized protein LOC135464199 [Liolophura sinensis]|uniref:uncharacterized protein LOC135464199 n=1 Tax=Liolophura sinensis TaxID=3198878 RepID=UPI00315980E9